MCTYNLFSKKKINQNSDLVDIAFGWVRLRHCHHLSFKMKTYIQFRVFFQHWTHFSKWDNYFWTKWHGPKCDDDKVKLKILRKSLLFSTQIWKTRWKHIFNFRCFFFLHLTHFLTISEWQGKISPAKTVTRTPSLLTLHTRGFFTWSKIQVKY